MEPRVSLITLGVEDLARARRFYEAGLGWKPALAVPDEVAFYQLGGLALGLYPHRLLAADAGLPSDSRPAVFRGTALAHNVPNPQLVDALLMEAERAGGRIVQPAEEKPWGGYSGHFADPDGHLWEVAWNPHFELRDDGTIRLPVQED